MTTAAQVLNDGKWRKAPAPVYQPATDRPLCKPDCPTCGGSGWVRGDFPVGHPQFGKLQPCPEMDLESVMPAYAAKFGLTKAERGLTWDDVLPLGNAAEAANRVAYVIERGYGWVYLWGSYGTAKTLILQIATAYALREGREAAYVRMADILDNLRQGISDSSTGQRLEWWQGLPLLCIDEFERVNETGYADEKRFQLMDQRYVSACRMESVTLIAGNADPSRFDGYLWDRIRDGRFEVIRMTGESVRPGMEYNLTHPDTLEHLEG